MKSIRVRLLTWLIGPILLLNLAGASLIYLLAWGPVHQAFDRGLQDAAAALAARVGVDGTLDLPARAQRALIDGSGSGAGIDSGATWFAVRDRQGRLLAGDAGLNLRFGDGATLLDTRLHGVPVRVAGELTEAGGTVAVARGSAARSPPAATVRVLLLLEALFTFVLAGLIWFAVTRGLLPLDRLRADLDARDWTDTAPVAARAVPVELAPVVAAFDNLLARLQAGTRAQHEFLANVAHQLRTPLAGVKLQLEWLSARHRDDLDTVKSVRLMLLSNERMIRQTNQLLALARAEPSRFEKTRLEPLDLAAQVAESIQHFVDRALAKKIDLGFELAPVTIAGDAFLLRDLIDNLVDNALRYTPDGGAVTVRCLAEPGQGSEPGAALLEVEDSGPGIAAAERERVFSRFVRLAEHTSGSGLGLAIVRDIALAHAAQVTMAAARGGPGALFQVRFPLIGVGATQ
ncbi:MAG: sensor histidine kinase [Massilia sp.]|nr:sensor histidine kinase [Massilia sp.]